MRSLLAGLIVCVCAVTGAAGQEVTVRPREAAGPLDNPFKGWCPYTDAGKIHAPYSMVFFPVSWQELEPREGQYAFDDWEKKAWNVEPARGKHVQFRVYLDMPNKPSGVPQWLRDKGLKLTPYTDHGGGVSPDYNDPRLVAGLEKLIAALGKRYDGHPRVAFLQLGLLGFWGEWHTYPRNELFASPETQKRIVDAYRNAFPHKKLMARDPANYVGQQAWIGFHDDMFPEDTDGSEGWKFLPKLRTAKRTDNWKQSVVGGEMTLGGNKPWLLERFPTTMQRLADTHFSWIGPYCPALESPPNAQFTERANELVRRMGYQFVLREMRHPAEVATGKELEIALEIENQGIAPFYYRWQIVWALCDKAGKPVQEVPVDWNVTNWLPGKASEKARLKITAQPGDYQLGLGIVDPWVNKPAIAFANDLPRHEGWTLVSKVKVRALREE